ncbi:MAG: hypothetical protein K2I64_05385 [Muribaculaceae bacterium]|nr:hypothetical protein [Muribaculaceae bacterium]
MNKFSRCVLFLSLLSASSSAYAVGFYGGVLHFDRVQGSYKSIPGLTFWVNDGWKIKEVPPEAMFTVSGQPADFTLTDYLVEGDGRGIFLKFPQVENHTTITVGLKPAFIKVYRADDPDNIINLNQIPGATNTSTGQTNIPYYINDIDQFEHKTRITNRNTENVNFVGGRYTMKTFAFIDATNNNIQKDIIRYTPDEYEENTGKLLKKNDDGTFEEVAVGEFSRDDLDLTLDFAGKFSAPGDYYLQYPTHGVIACMYLNSSGVLNNQSRHISNIMVGPITVSGGSPDTGVMRLDWQTPSTFYLDDVPDMISLRSLNATNILLNDADAKVHVTLTDNTTGETVEADVAPVITGNSVGFPVSPSIFSHKGTYNFTSRIDQKIFGINDQCFVLNLPKEYSVSRTFTVVEPSHPDNLNVYLKSSSAQNIEIEEDEAITLRLAHESQAGGMKIFVRWTPETDTPYSVYSTASDEDGFAEHTGDMTISGPGMLEYYTRISNSDSDIKTINVSLKSQTEPSDPSTGVDEVAENLPDGDSTWYDLKGRRVENPSNGIFIRRHANGRSEKMLISGAR